MRHDEAHAALDDDLDFGHLALRLGAVSERQLARARQVVALGVARGTQPRRLARVLVRQGALSSELARVVRDLLEAQRRTCPRCGWQLDGEHTSVSCACQPIPAAELVGNRYRAAS